MKSDNIRLRFLKVLEILKKQTDRLHPMSSAEIINELERYDIQAERKAVYKDIEALQELGFNVVKTGTPKRGFYLDDIDFQMPEVSLLIDAVQSAGFIPKKRTEQLVLKLQGLLSVHQAAEIKSRVCIENRSKSANESVYDIIELLSSAISQRQQVKVKYTKQKLNGTRLVASIKEMTINPYALLWESDHYYLIGNNVKYDNLTHLRVDRIASAELLKSAARHFSEVSEYSQRFDVADYARKTFNMFGGEKCRIDLECNVELLDQITDKFTEGIFIRHFDDESTFRFTTDALISDGLVGWLMQFGGDIKVLSPESLKQSVISKAKTLSEIYEK